MLGRLRTSREQRDFEAFVRAMLRSGDSSAVFERVADLDVPPPYRIRVKVVYASVSPMSVMGYLEERGFVQRLAPQTNSYACSSSASIRDRRARAPFFLASFAGGNVSERVQAVVAICNSSQWKALMRFVGNAYPRLVPVLLSQSDLVHAVRRLRARSGHEVRVRDISAKVAIQTAEGKGSKSVREWTDQHLGDALAGIQESRQLVTSLEVEFFPILGGLSHVRPKSVCKLRKNGEMEVAGSFRLAFNTVADYVARVGDMKLQFYSKRGLRESEYKPRPLAIRYGHPIFEDVEEVRSFVRVLASYPRSMHSVVHGNPHAEVRLTDLLDGSSFDVWAVPPAKLAIVPGLKGTEAALERLVHYIFDKFREGEVVEYGGDGRALEVLVE